MIRPLSLLALLCFAAAPAAALPRTFTVTSFDRIRVEAPFAVTLATGRSSFARADGPAAALDAIDLRVEGRTLILRQRRSSGGPVLAGPVRISLGTPNLHSASVVGSGSLAIQRLTGLSVDLALGGAGSLTVEEVAADRLVASVQGSGALTLGGRVKTASLTARGAAALLAEALRAEEVTIVAEGTAEVAASARTLARVTAAGTVGVRLSGAPACELKVSGSATVEGCAARRR